MSFLTAGLSLILSAAGLPQWSFESDMQGWTPNTHLSEVRIESGALKAKAADWDPMLIRSGLQVPASPWQYVTIRLSADRPGSGELFWSGETGGPHGGFSQHKSSRFEITGGGSEEIVVYPFWQGEKMIRQLRLDLFEGAEFAIQSISIGSWGDSGAVQQDAYAWELDKKTTGWRSSGRELFAPPLDLETGSRKWAAVELTSSVDGVAELIWAAAAGSGSTAFSFPIVKTSEPRLYNVNLGEVKEWGGRIQVLGLRLPKGARAKSLRLSDAPEGPAELQVRYVGIEDAIPRAGRKESILVQMVNAGGKPTEPGTVRLVLPVDLKFVDSVIEQPLPALKHGEVHELLWDVQASKPGDYELLLGYGRLETAKAKVVFSEPVLGKTAAYVPEPKPVYTPFDVCAYYFPGWEKPAKWECIREMPNRKPALGYYDESNPECVDWQIKWAVENAISCFLVDWYWCEGKQHLTHWFDAYRQAKYRDMLKVAIMWANHNAPGTHSAEDLRNVVREWIDKYFNLPAYYRLNGKPAVFIWAPANIRNDLGGSEAVRKAMDEAQEAARQAGYPGITFVALGYDFSKHNIESLLAEGYSGVTTYHEWGASMNAQGPQRIPFEQVAATAAESWAEKNAAAGPLTYYPVIDTGWDSRPWHGDKSLVFEGRTPALFRQLLESAWHFAVANDKQTVILGPVNEWGEGSYIEPCVEYGFEMYEKVRQVFAPDGEYPENVAPADVDRGPFDYPDEGK